MSVRLLFFIFIFAAAMGKAGETSRGETTSGGTDARPMSSNNAFAEQIRNACPAALTEWVDDDFSDQKASIFGVIPLPIDFPSEANKCLRNVKEYEASIKKSGKKTSLSDSEAMSTYLADRYKQISPNVNHVLSKCNNLPDGKDKVVKARYYMAATKVEAVNSTVLDEMAFIDGLVPQDAALKKMDCNTIFPFPQVGKKCEEYKKMLDGSCKQTQDDRLNAMVQKSKLIMDQVRQLQAAYRDCSATRKADPSVCENINLAMQMLKSEAPWIDGKKFQDKANNAEINTFWKDSLKDDYIKKGIVEQLTENRKTFQKEYDKNIEQVKCLTYAKTNGKASCSFEDARQYISQLPDLVEAPASTTQASREFSGHVEAEKCLIERGMDRASTKKIIDDAVTDLAVTVSTAGLGAVANGGLKVVKGLSAVSKLRTASFANAAMATLNLSSGVRQALESCNKASESLLKFTGKPEVLKDNLCPESSSKFEIAQQSNTSCLTDALLTSVDVWPFVKGLKMATQLSKFSAEDMLKMYKDPSQRAAVEKILAKNGKLTDPERLDAAETLLGRKLSSAEKTCVIDAHNVAAGKTMRVDLSTFPLATDYSGADLLAKKSVLSACGIGSSEIALLMRSGITGTTSMEEANRLSTLRNYENAKKAAQGPRDNSGMYGYESLWGQSALSLGKYDEAEKAYKQAFNIIAEKNGLDKAKPDQINGIISRMSTKEVSDLSDYASATGRNDLLGAIEKRKISDIEKEASRGYGATSLESLNQGSNYADLARRQYYLTLVEQSRSTVPMIKKMGEERLKVFMKIYPGMR